MNKCIFANDIDEYCCKVYRKRWNDGTLLEKDIKNVSINDICRNGKPDLICAGVPCHALKIKLLTLRRVNTMSMSPDVTINKNTENWLNSKDEYIKQLEESLSKKNELIEQLEKDIEERKIYTKRHLGRICIYNTAISYLEDRCIDLEEEIAKRDIVITKYQKLFEETNNALKKIGI